MNRYTFILAGGSGKRLWPLGRQKLPKQFIPFKEGKTLLELTIDRISKIIPHECIWIVTTQEYYALTHNTVGHLVGTIIAEPEARNTGPAIFYALEQLQKIDTNASVIITPADHAIEQTENFIDTLKKASTYAEQNNTMVLCGVQPTSPATGYGYIECVITHDDIVPVIRFHEKPTRAIAQQYISTGNFLWNTGIVCAPIKTVLQEFSVLTSAQYSTLADESFDCMILEKSKNVRVVKANFDWSDVGTLDLFIAAQHDCASHVIAINAHNTIAHGVQKLVVINGVDDISVIETDDVLLISKRSETEKIKQVVDYLKASGYEEFI